MPISVDKIVNRSSKIEHILSKTNAPAAAHFIYIIEYQHINIVALRWHLQKQRRRSGDSKFFHQTHSPILAVQIAIMPINILCIA
jgi:hypothetical protein